MPTVPDALDRQRAETANVAAETARKAGDFVTIHLLAGAEEASQRGETAIAGHLLQLAGFRMAGRDVQVCEALGDQMRTFGRLVYGPGAR